MALEYITDENGLTKEVRMSIADWNALKEKYEGIEEEVYDIPQWQKDELDKRLKMIEEGKESFITVDELKAELDKRF